MKIITGVTAAIAAVAVVLAGLLFVRNTQLQKQLFILENADLAQENKLLQVKLDTAEKDGAEAVMRQRTLEQQLAERDSRIQVLGATAGKIRLYLTALEAFNDWRYGPSGLHIADRDTSRIDAAIEALDEPAIADLWSTVKAGFPQAKETGALRYDEVILLLTSRIRTLLSDQSTVGSRVEGVAQERSLSRDGGAVRAATTSQAEKDLAALRATVAKAKQYLAVLSAVWNVYGTGGPLPWDVRPINAAVSAAKDPALTVQWETVRRFTDARRGSHSSADTTQLFSWLIQKIPGLLK